MKEINNSIALILFLFNFFGSIGILIAGFYYPDSPFYVKNDDDYSDFKPINYTINIVGNLPTSKENLENFSYFEKYKAAKIAQEEEDSTDVNKLNLGLYFNFSTIYFCMYICVSFFVDEIDCPECRCELDERINSLKDNKFTFFLCFPCIGLYYFLNGFCFCCSQCCQKVSDCCDDCCKGCDCNCNSSNCSGSGNEGMAGLALILCAVMVVAAVIGGFFYLIYFLTSKCGKILIRYITFIVNTLVNIIIFCLAYSVIDEKEKSIYAVMALSGLIFISNIIGIILSNVYENFCLCNSFYISYESICEQTNKIKVTPDNLDYNLEAEANRDQINPPPTNFDQMIEYQYFK